MAKRIVWSPQAKADLFSILEYWNNKNMSKTYFGNLISVLRIP